MLLMGLSKILVAAALFIELPVVAARAILGVDLGSLYMKVALVQSGSPLEIVTNMHSKRKTEQMILFDNNQRFYGADASALLARKSHKTPAAMSVLLGRDDQHPSVQVLSERHYPVRPFYNETRSGVTLKVDGIDFTPEELVAMVLSHAVDISVAYAAESGTSIPPPKDCVLTVPIFATVLERRALLDAAALADLNVLTLIDENTAAALHYAMDKKFEDDEQLILFYNMGASSLQVSLIRFFNYEQPQKFGSPKSVPALEVLAKAWDETCGGQAFDHVLVEMLADEFNAAWHKAYPEKSNEDVRSVPRAMTKLKLQANKCKHVLSANSDIPVHLDSVHDDVTLDTHVTREQFEKLVGGLLERTTVPVTKVLEIANKTVADLTAVELVGGGMRIPSVQHALKATIGDEMEVGLHINADESFALGAAFAGANISTAFRVRHVGMTDVNPFAMKIALSDLPPSVNEEEEPWGKEATIFKAFGKLGVKKTIAFTHDSDVHCALDYVESDELPKGTELSLERYNITGVREFAAEMNEKGLGKPKVSLQFELSASGIVTLVKAEAAVEETYTVEEEVEVDDNSEDGVGDIKTEPVKESNEADEVSKEEEDKKGDDLGKEDALKNETSKDSKEKPKKKTIMVEKEKKKIHRKSLSVLSYYTGRVQPHTEELLEASKLKLRELAEKDKARMMLEKSKNKVESYIYKIKNKLIDDEEKISKYTDEEQREEVRKLAEEAEAWLDEDGYNADLATMEDKYAEMSIPFEKILLRISESTERPRIIEDIQKKLTEIETLIEKWRESKPQVTEEERTEVLDKVKEARKWIEEKEVEQAKRELHDDAVFLSPEVVMQYKPVQEMVMRLNRRPKPKEDKNQTISTTDAQSINETATENVTATNDDTSSVDTGGDSSESRPVTDDLEPEDVAQTKEDTESSVFEEEKTKTTSEDVTSSEEENLETTSQASDDSKDESVSTVSEEL